MSDSTLGQLRQRHLAQILAALRENHGATRSELAKATGLSESSVTRLVSVLLESGVLVVSGLSSPGIGRPAGVITFNPERSFVAGVDCGEEEIRVGIAGMTGECRASVRTATLGDEGGEVAFDRLCEAVAEATEQVGLSPSELAVITIGVAGMVDHAAGIVLEAPNIRGWVDYPLREKVEERFPSPVVIVENDINLAALGEYYMGSGNGAQSLVFLSLRKGIGGGFLIDGELYRGSTGLAGEVGFMAFDASYSPRQMGGLGHLETLAGGVALLRDNKLTSASSSQAASKADTTELEALLLAARDGIEPASEILDEALTYFAIAAANVTSILDPELLVVGGDITLLGDRAIERVKDVICRVAPRPVRVALSSLSQEATLQGALAVAVRRAQDVIGTS